MYGPRFFPSNAADSADIPRPLGYLLVGRSMLLSEGTRVDKGPFGSERPSFVRKIFKQRHLSIHVSSNVSHL